MRLPGPLADRKVLALDWDRESIRIVHTSTSRKGPRGVRGVFVPVTEGVDIDDPEALGQFIGRALKQRRIRTRRAIVSIPRDQAVLHMLSLPNVPPDEMPSVVHFQITKELPFALEEAKIDFATFPAEAEAENVDVLVAAVRNDVLEHYQQVCQNAGLQLERVGLRPFANTVAALYGREDEQTGCLLLVDVGPTLTEIDLIRQGRLSFSRAASVNVPILPAVRSQGSLEGEGGPVMIAPTDTEQEEAVESLMVEVNRTIEAYRVTDPGAEIGSVVIGGSCGIEDRLCREIEERFGAPARLYNPGETIAKLADRGDEFAAFSAPLGLSIGHGTEGVLHFDFLHPKEPVDLGRERARRIPMIAASVLLLLVAMMGFRWRVGSIRDAEVEVVKEKAEKLKEEAKEVDEFKDQVMAASAWAERELVWLEELATITNLFPDTSEVYATKFYAKDEGRISFEVRAKIMPRLEKLRMELEKLGPYIARLGTVKQVGDARGYNFQTDIILQRKPDEDFKGSDTKSKKAKSNTRSKRRR